MKLVVGFLTYNEASAKYLPDFLASLKKSLSFLASEDYRVLALDNSDQNNNLNRLAIEFFNKTEGSFVEYLNAGDNLGFGRAYNLLINKARLLSAEYFFVINPDTCLEIDAARELVKALDLDQKLSAVSPKLLRWDFATNTKTRIIDSGGLILKAGLRFKDLGQGEKDTKQLELIKIIGPSGAAGLFRLRDLEKIKSHGQYFDEQFFMYKEDCDLAYRLTSAGLISKLVPTALIYHDRTAAAAGQGVWQIIRHRRQKSRQIRSWSFLNQHLLFVKHWKTQNIISRIIIILQIAIMFIFALILEQFLLKNYTLVLKSRNT